MKTNFVFCGLVFFITLIGSVNGYSFQHPQLGAIPDQLSVQYQHQNYQIMLTPSATLTEQADGQQFTDILVHVVPSIEVEEPDTEIPDIIIPVSVLSEANFTDNQSKIRWLLALTMLVFPVCNPLPVNQYMRVRLVDGHPGSAIVNFYSFKEASNKPTRLCCT